MPTKIKQKPKVEYWHCDCGKTKVKGPQKITVIAMRHGESRHNVLGVVNGDPKKIFHLTPKGRWQARKLAQKLKDKNITAILTSEMLRTQESAEPLAKLKNLPIEIDKRLNDIRAGDLEGIGIAEFRTLTDNINRSVKSSENNIQVAKRLKSFLEDLMETYPGKTVVIVSSEIILHSLKQIAEGEESDENIGKHIQNAMIYEFHLQSPICCKTCGDRCEI